MNTKNHLQNKLEEVRDRFLSLVETISDRALIRKWPGEGWTIKEELVHIVQVVEVLPAGIERASKGDKLSLLGFVPANFRGWVNGHIVIPWKAKNETRESIKKAYRDAHNNLINLLEKLTVDDWEKGMPYPRKFRTVEQMAYRPVEHFEEHEAHIHRLLKIDSQLYRGPGSEINNRG